MKPRELAVGLTVWQKALEGICEGEAWQDRDLVGSPTANWGNGGWHVLSPHYSWVVF